MIDLNLRAGDYMNLTIMDGIRVAKKSFENANSCNVLRVYNAIDKIIKIFPEIMGKNRGYVVLTLGEFATRKNSPEWLIRDLKRNNEFEKKGMFILNCFETKQINNFTGEAVLTTPELIYYK
jgi:hypothetical protein